MHSSSSWLLAAVSMAVWHAGAAAAQDPVNLGTAGNFAILAKAGISTTGVTVVVGDMGVSPIDSTAITGFSLTLDASGNFSTSSLLTGKAYASDYVSPTPSYLTTAVGDMEIAYADAAGRTAGNAITELGAGDISGMTLAPGLYKWGTGLLINSDITLAGSPCGVWIFQIGENLTVADAVHVILSGGAQAARIFWQVAGEANLGTTSHFAGIILSQTAINLQTGTSINGILLAQSAVTLDASTVTIPNFAELELAEWFGWYYDGYVDPVTGAGWIYHAEHGWLYRVDKTIGMWIWDQQQKDWFWTSVCIYPYLYSGRGKTWVYYHEGGNPVSRWFYYYDKPQNNCGKAILNEWFGWLYDGHLNPETGAGWIYQAEHGWLYMVAVANGIWVWDQIQQDWLWTNACIYPYLYSGGAATWVFYHAGGTPVARWFFFYDNQQHNGGVWQSAIGE
jgi:hypothetical protein